MAEPLWWFYLAWREPLVECLAPMLEKCLQRGWRVLVVGSPERIESLDTELWTWRDDSFLPHGRDHPDRQPVALSSECRIRNQARVLVLLDMEVQPPSGLERIIFLTSRQDQSSTAAMVKRCRQVTTGDRRCFVQSSGRWQSVEDFHGHADRADQGSESLDTRS